MDPVSPASTPSIAQAQLCPNCKLPIEVVWSYCPSCGTPLKEVKEVITPLKQIGIYLFSFLLPPFGLVPGIKYFKNKDPKIKSIGLIAILLTIVSIVLMLVVYKAANDYYQKLLESVTYPY